MRRAQVVGPVLHTPEQLVAYAHEKLGEIDALIAEMEKKVKTSRGTTKTWLEGAIHGLKVARTAWSIWR